MTLKWKAFRLVSLLALSLVLFVTVWGSAARAQTSTRPDIDITGINLEQLPDVRISVYGENLGAELNALPVIVREDGVEQELLNNERAEIGIQTALLIDSSRNISDPGNTGDLRYIEIANAVQRFVSMGLLAAYEDLLAVYSAGETVDDFRTIAEWNGNHQDVVNQVRLYTPGDAPVRTPLFNLIKATLDEFEAAPGPTNLRRSMVVFSDGFDSLSAVQIDDVVNRAARQGVAIHTVMIGPEDQARRQNLQRIADNTGGTYRVYTELDDMESLWSLLAAERIQYWLTYHLSQARPEQVSVEVTLPSGQKASAEAEFPLTPVQPPVINIRQPAAGDEIQRVGSYADATLAELEPRTWPIELDISWPDGFPRTFERIDYEIGGRTESQSSEPFGRFDFPIDELGARNYTLRVTAVDELGLESKSAPVSFRVTTLLPDLPTPPPTDAPAETPQASETPVEGATTEPAPLPTEGPPTDVPPDDNGGTKTYLGGLVEYSPVGGTWGTLTVGGFELPLTPLSAILIWKILMLIIALLVYLFMSLRKKDEVDMGGLYADDPYTAATIGAESTQVDAMAYELTEDATEPQLMPDFITPAALEYVEGERDVVLPKRLNIDGGREVRLGRKDTYCDIIIDDPRISRLHCAIQEREDGKFYIRDEGSSGGTFVNRRKLSANDMRPLNHGDIINFNTVAYRFIITEDEDQEIKANPDSWTGS